jgi:hypothetical protein
MGLKQMLCSMDREELAYQMAYDLIEAEERPTGPARSSSRPPAASRGWIDLTDPAIFDKLKRAAGL